MVSVGLDYRHLPLQVVICSYRATVAPPAYYIEALHRQDPDITLTVVVPEVVPATARSACYSIAPPHGCLGW